MHKKLHLIATAVAVFFFQAVMLAPVSAQSAAASAAAARNPEYQALFKRMFANPRDIEATFRFAEVAERLGDYEAAIGALERVLMFNPNLPQVKLRLGALYQRIGGKEMALTYFSQAIATPGAKPDVVAAAQQFVNNTPETSVAPTRGFYLYAHTGMRYQTNASAGPNSSLIRQGGDPAFLTNEFAKQADWNYFAQAAGGYNYDLAPGITAEASFFGYYAKQFKLDRFDLGLVEGQLGPRFALPWLFTEGSFKIYGIGTASWLAESPYYSGPGIGASARFFVPNLFWLEPSYEWRDRTFRNSELYPSVSDQSGNLQIAALNASGVAFGMAWFGRVSGIWNRSDEQAFDFNSYDRWTADIGFAVPIGRWWRPEQVVVSPFIGYSKTDYAHANPDIDPAVVRADKEWHVGAALDLPIYDHWGLRTLVRYTETSSNLPNFATKNFSVSFGPTYRY